MNPVLSARTVEVEPTQVRLIQELKHASPLLGCRFDTSGTFVFAGAQDNGIQRWELAGGKKTTLAGHESWVRGLVSVPKSKLLISGDYHGRVLWWTADTPAP